MARVVVIGDLMTDTVAHARLALARGSDTPASVTMHGGGSGANIAAWMAADGGDVAFVGRRGADIAGRNRDMELMGYGVDARLVMDPERPTGTCVVMVTHKGERTMMSDPGANAALSPDDLPHDLFVPGAHLHVSGYTLLSEGSRAAGLAAIEYARRAGMTASADAASASLTTRSTSERSAKSALTQSTPAPSARSPSAAPCNLSLSRATSTTRAPARPSARAISAPMPELPPVTTATRPASENSSSRIPGSLTGRGGRRPGRARARPAGSRWPAPRPAASCPAKAG